MKFDIGGYHIGCIYKTINIELYSGGVSILPSNIKLVLEKWGDEQALEFFQQQDSFFYVSIWFDEGGNFCVEDFDGCSFCWSKEEFTSKVESIL